MTRIAITGGRSHWPTREEMRRFTNRLVEVEAREMLHGACPTGVDALVSWYVRVAPGLGAVKVVDVPVDHRYDGPWPGAGPRRNGRMLAMEAEELIAFPGNRGTADCVRQAKARGVPVYFVGGKDGEG